MDVIVYSTPVCPYCTMAKDFLKKHKIPFKDFNVMDNQERAREMVKKSGQTGVPVIDISGKIIVGFDEPRLREILKIK